MVRNVGMFTFPDYAQSSHTPTTLESIIASVIIFGALALIFYLAYLARRKNESIQRKQ